jgi:hypothetical protein
MSHCAPSESGAICVEIVDRRARMDQFIGKVVGPNSKLQSAAEYGVVLSVLLVAAIAILRVWGVIR